MVKKGPYNNRCIYFTTFNSKKYFTYKLLKSFGFQAENCVNKLKFIYSRVPQTRPNVNPQIAELLGV